MLESNGARWYSLVLEEAKDDLKSQLERNEPFDLIKIRGVAVSVAEALQHLHSRDLVHGALAPENVLVCGGNEWGGFVV